VKIIRDPAEMAAWSREQCKEGKTIGFVPTMGFFHEGHLSLMRMAERLADQVVVSLFVNPTQFGPGEDLTSYPSDFERDRELAAAAGAGVLFTPTAEAMYPAGSSTTVIVSGLTDTLCGASRPGHFAGVTTVVSKLFHLVHPNLAVFGQKDFQQLAVIRRMCLDLNMGIEIVGHPIVREADGLAMSSRNSYLDGAQRQSALCLSRALRLARQLAADGERSASRLTDAARQLIASYPATTVDYISFVDQTTLQDVSTVDEDTVLALAVKIGDKVRLIDNGYVIESSDQQY
jgi:pantoate--beta-alanine ligase